MRATALIVDDELSICELLDDWLSQELGLSVFTAQTAAESERILDERPVDILLADLQLQESSGLDVIRVARRRHTSEPEITADIASSEYYPAISPKLKLASNREAQNRSTQNSKPQVRQTASPS